MCAPTGRIKKNLVKAFDAAENARVKNNLVDRKEFRVLLADLKAHFYQQFIDAVGHHLLLGEHSNMSKGEFAYLMHQLAAWGLTTDPLEAYNAIDDKRALEWRGTGTPGASRHALTPE